MQGYMTVRYNGSEVDAEAVENFVLHHIERAMMSETILRNGIEELYYLNRNLDAGAPIVDDTNQETSDSGEPIEPNNVAMVSTLSAGVFLILLAVFVTVAARMSRRKRDSRLGSGLQEVDDMNEHSASIDVGSDDGTKYSEHNLHSVSKISNIIEPNVVNDPVADASSLIKAQPTELGSKSLVATVATVPTSSISNLLSPSIVPSHSVQENMLAETTVTVTTEQMAPNNGTLDILADSSFLEENVNNSREFVGSARKDAELKMLSENPSSIAPVLPDTLPPKPPGGITTKLPSSASKTIKVNRKKKKRKKQNLVRVNSREHMAEMETISEEKDERSDSDEEGSDYSCSTDDSGSRPGSRETSPTRAEPRSRELSPSNRSKGPVSSYPAAKSNSMGFDNLHILETIDLPKVSSDDSDSQKSKEAMIANK